MAFIRPSIPTENYNVNKTLRSLYRSVNLLAISRIMVNQKGKMDRVSIHQPTQGCSPCRSPVQHFNCKFFMNCTVCIF